MTGSDQLPRRSTVTFVDAMAEVMRVRRMSVRQLARAAETSPSHLSRALRGAQHKQPSVALLERLAAALEISPDYFLEVRRSRVVAQLGHDAGLVDELYDRWL
jgi:transcriptional regulator with XRE-family HTH domain